MFIKHPTMYYKTYGYFKLMSYLLRSDLVRNNSIILRNSKKRAIMNNFLLGLIFLCLNLPKPIKKNYPNKKPITIEQDLFQNPVDIKAAWLGYLQSNKTSKYISNVPMFIYRNTQLAYAKIICIPAQLNDWNAKFRGKSIAQKTSITKTLTRGIIGHSFDKKQFAIYAFFPQQNDKGIQFDKNNNITTYPVTIQVYKNEGTKWSFIAQRKVANSLDYQQYQYDVAVSAQ